MQQILECLNGERVFIVGFRDDLHIGWQFPQATHSDEVLQWNQWVANENWEVNKVSEKDRPESPASSTIAKLERKYSLIPPDLKPWITVREALMDLPHPRDESASNIPNHEYRDGARVYPGHTGSPIDAPSKALKAGDHGVPGGENMIRYNNGDVRYFTMRESARIQTFPDDYIISGSWTEGMRQLGNAVPVQRTDD